MPKKRTDGFEKKSIAEQQAEIERFHGRKAVREANSELATMIYSWLVDRPVDRKEFNEFMQRFEAAGHQGQYHESPNRTTSRRVLPQATELPNILKRLADAPVDYAAALELSYVYARIMDMVETLATEPRGTMEQAIELYRQVGAAIRQKVFNETGQYPEDFPIPRGRITGTEKPDQFKLRDHQPPLFED